MSTITISLIVFGCILGGAVFGALVRASLPEHHLSADSKQSVTLGMGLVATMSALVLGLLVSSAKSYYDTQSAAVATISAKVILLDRVLAHYGPEAKEPRDQLRAAVVDRLNKLWPPERNRPFEGIMTTAEPDDLYDRIGALSPTDDKQRTLKTQALSMAIDLGQTRWLAYAQGAASVSKTMLAIVVFWLTVLFFSFGLFAPRNATVTMAFVASGLSVSGAIFLILELYQPYAGLIEVSSVPLRSALTQIGR